MPGGASNWRDQSLTATLRLPVRMGIGPSNMATDGAAPGNTTGMLQNPAP
jgi:hypothetical protein